ncbi:hypothetical protein EDD66_112102 [Mobilisporobacter senegalensis]|uniref:Uncharacterized protein n=1 Tax=Mobilisporobacter senegalensis TaxID=1329262 RepID=A0A3N1XCW9_9FIRM|nr:hypothetical protein [Mobilisporobacter senegalensis]ROR23971.1 hypothetical protein EDD66_112102 [Mobilisporobacter senegalensis]
MKENKFICPICNSSDMTLRHEVNFVYSYKIDIDEPGLKNSEVFLSYEYDKRENKYSREYIECNRCGTQYPNTFLNGILGN